MATIYACNSVRQTHEFTRLLPRTRSARSASGPKSIARLSHRLVDLPRSRAMSQAAGIEAIETKATIHHADMDDSGFAAPNITRNRRRLGASAKSETASGGGLFDPTASGRFKAQVMAIVDSQMKVAIPSNKWRTDHVGEPRRPGEQSRTGQ
jgi:hypothetical protein